MVPRIRRQDGERRRALAVRRRQQARRRRATHRLEPVAVRKGLGRREFPRRRGRCRRPSCPPSFLGGCHHDQAVKPGTISLQPVPRGLPEQDLLPDRRRQDLPTHQGQRRSRRPGASARTNSFLRFGAGPDRSPITSRARSTPPTRSRSSTWSSDIDKTLGTWSMSSVLRSSFPRVGIPRLPGRPGRGRRAARFLSRPSARVRHRPGADRAGPR